MTQPMKMTALVLGGILIGAGGTYFSVHHAGGQLAQNVASSPAASSNQSAAGSKGKKILYWYDPMMPNQHFDKPGKSPFMDMPLVPVYAEGGNAAPGTVSIDPRVVQNMGVRTAKVETGSFANQVATVGYVQPDERRIEVVQSRAAGYVERLSVRAENDPVKRGQLLAAVYAPDLLAAEEEYLLARRTDAALASAARQKLVLLGVSDSQIRQLARTGQATRRIAYYSPANGIVSKLGVREGSQVTPGMTMFEVVDLSSVWVNAQVLENQAADVRQGDPVTVTVPALPGETFRGTVEYVLPQVNEASRTLVVRVRLNNPRLLLKPGMYANVNLTGSTQPNVLLVPSESVISTGRRNVVIVSDGNGKFHPAEVKLGQERGGKTEILSGLTEGQTVVSSGQFLIDSESSLKTSLDRLQGAPTTPAPSVAKPAAAQPAARSAAATHHGVGVVNSIDQQAGTVNLTHQAIPSLHWPGMTMDFPVKNKAQLAALKAGDHVTFALIQENGRPLIVLIQKGQ